MSSDSLASIRALIEPCELLHQRIDSWLVTPTGKEIDDPVCLLDDAHRFLGELSAVLASVEHPEESLALRILQEQKDLEAHTLNVTDVDRLAQMRDTLLKEPQP